MPQNPMLGLGGTQYMNAANQPGQPPMTMPPNSAPNPAMNMLGSQNPNPQQRFTMQIPPGNPMQHRTMMVRPGGPDGQPMNPAMHNQMQGMNLPPGANSLAARRAVSQPQLSQAPLGHMGMNPQTSMPAQVRVAMGRPNPMPPENMRQGPMHIMPGGGLAQPPGGMGNPANFPNVHQPPLSSSPRPGGPHPQGPPNMGPGGQHMNRASVGGDEFMYQNHFPPGPSNRNNQFTFNPSSPPPMNEMSNMGNPSAPNRSSFQPTPVDQYKVLHPESNYPPFAIPGRPPPNGPVPPRPPSINQPPSQIPSSQQPHHAPSPHASPMYPPQRPPSRPSSRTAPPHPPQTPRPIPPQGPQPPSRLPSNPQPPVHQQQPGGGPQPIAPRPPQGPSIPGSSPNATAGQSPEHQQAQPQPQQQPGPNLVTIPRPPVLALLGSGQALTRLLQFSGNLSSESPSKYRLSWWQELITEYFTPKAVMKLTLWKDNQRHEAKPFEIGVPILPRFFLVTTQSGVKSMTLSLDGARERMYAHGHAIVECVTAIWTYRYKNGYIVTLRGPLTAHVVVTSGHPPGTQSVPGSNGFILRFEDFSFDANFHDKYIALDSIQGSRNPIVNDLALSPRTPRMRNAQGISGLNGNTISDDEKYWEEPRLRIDGGSIPGEPVNAFGIPQATMRCLELAESVAQMADLITFADETKEGPIEALTKYANKLLEAQGQPPIGIQPIMNGMPNGQPHPSLPFAPPFSNPGSTLYSSAPSSVANPSSAATTSTMSSPQNAPPSAQNSPQKQHKTIPQPSVPSNTSNSNPAAAASTPGSANNTPALTTTSLKRKQPSDPSPPTTESNPTKRVTRGKRGRGAGG